jgi:WD40 repeat protein/DNA-binding CsgD family transcriptional regulator
MENLTGQTIKGYDLLERIGSGGFGAVYRAYQSTIGREVAVKIILPGYANQPEFIRRFEAEAQLVARLEHLHIVPLYDYWREPGGAYLVMRWLRGGSLKEALRERPFDLAPAALLLNQVASALATAHANQVIHRDLKPSNILLDEEGNAYLADFGIAKDLGQTNGELTRQEAIVGSPDYLSPEQARSQPVTPQTDIYSLGVTLYEILTGAHPFPGQTAVERLFKHINDPLPLMETLDPTVQDAVNEVIQRATAKDPKHRYQDVLAMAAAFREAARLDADGRTAALVEALTLREQEILHFILEGYTNRQIAQALFIELATVKWHIRQLYTKLGVRSRRQAMMKGRELELLLPGQKDEDEAATLTTGVSLALPAPANPYKGLRAFETADSRHFFGRETLIQRLLSRLSTSTPLGAVPSSPHPRTPSTAPGAGPPAHRFLAVVGPSGSGKSSLVKAGLIPALWQGAIPGSAGWFVVEMVPGARPLDELEVALIRVAADQAENLRHQLERDRNGLLRAAELILPRDDSELVLVIDQFEELFTLVADEAARTHFLDLLTAAVTDPRSRLRLIITLRADYYDRPLHYPEFGGLLRSHMETVLPLSAEQLERAIVQPAQQVGVAYEAGLVAAIIEDTLYQPGALPLLQYALTELFEARDGRTLTRVAYETIGSAPGALARRAEELYQEQDAAGREAIRQMLLRLVSPAEAGPKPGRSGDGAASADTRRRALRSELAAVAADADLMDELIDLFAAYRLLTLDHHPASRRPTVEVAHEMLLGEWARLRRWLEESRADLRLQQQLARAATEWRQAGEDASFLLRGARLEQFQAWSQVTELALTDGEREYLQASVARRDQRAAAEAARQAREATLERRARRVLVALAAVFLLAAMISGWFALDANRQRGEAERNLAYSESQRLAAEATNILQRGGSPELAALLALRGLDTHYTSQADMALQHAASAFIDAVVFEAPGRSLWPVMSPDNRYLRFARINRGEAAAPMTELWDMQTRERLWQTSNYIVPGLPFDIRNATADYAGVVAVTLDVSTALLLDVETGERLLTFQGNASPFVFAQLSADGKRFVASVRDGDVHVWNMETGEEMRRFSVGGGGYAREPGRELMVAISPDSRLVVATAAGLTYVWDIESGAELYRFEHERQGLLNPPQFTDGGRLLLAAVEPAISLWDLSTGQEVEHGLPPSKFGLLSPDGRIYAHLAGKLEEEVILRDVATGRELHRLTGHSDGARLVAFADGGHQLITWGWDGTARVWDVASGRELLVLAGHTDNIQDAALSPDERYLITTSQDETVRIWDLQAPRHQDYRLGGVSALLQLSPDGRVALTADPETGAAMLVEAESLAVRHHLGFTPDPMFDGWTARPSFSGDGQLVLGASGSGTILVYDVASGELIAEHATPDDVYKHPVFIPGSRRIFAGGNRGAYLLDAESGRQLRLFDEPDDYVSVNPYTHQVAVSGDGRYGAMHRGESGAVVYLWDLETGNLEFRSAPDLTDWIVALALSGDGRYFAWGGQRSITYVLDLHSGEEVMRLAHLDTVHQIEFSSDNRFLLTSAGGDGVILWDLESGQIVRRFFAGSGQVGMARFAEEDAFILYATFEDGVIHRQLVSPEGLIESMCARVQRDLTAVERQRYGLDDSPTCPQLAGS